MIAYLFHHCWFHTCVFLDILLWVMGDSESYDDNVSEEESDDQDMFGDLSPDKIVFSLLLCFMFL